MRLFRSPAVRSSGSLAASCFDLSMCIDASLERMGTKPKLERVYLNVPFAEKDLVKSLGAKWDSDTGCWYVAAGSDPTPFVHWRPIWPHYADPVVKVLGLPIQCWKCHTATLAVIACQGGDQVAFAHKAVLQVLASQLTHEELADVGAGPLRPRFANTTGQSIWSNGCVDCDALQGGIFLRENFLASISQGQADLPTITFAKVPVDVLRGRSELA